MTIPEKAAAFAKRIAEDDSHGYDQANRWGPDYDCSSLVIRSYQEAGVPLTCTYTGNMRSNMLDNGFAIPTNVNLQTGAGLRVGDVLLNVQHHAAMYVGDGKIVNAGGNETGGVTGGKTGDQTGREIAIVPYYDFPWDFCLRYVRGEEPEKGPVNEYEVQQGDTLWEIAERVFGAGQGFRYTELMELNGLKSIIIYPGQILRLPTDIGYRTITATVTEDTYKILALMAEGWGKTIGEVIDSLTEDAH